MKDYNVYTIKSENSGKKLGKYLRNVLMLSRRTVVKLKQNCSLSINGESCTANTVLNEGDVLEITLSQESSDNIISQDMKLDIVYEDEYLIVINKPSEVPVHPTRGYKIDTLANGLKHYFTGRERSTVIRPVNRLDKNTTGLVVFAKNSHIQYLLTKNPNAKEFQKRYIAVVTGVPINESEYINMPIGQESSDAIKRVVREDGYNSITFYEVKEKYNNSALLKLELLTGRTHQIRVHMSFIGHPLVGDVNYGGTTDTIGRQALHANKIKMLHPVNKQWIELEAPLPKDMKHLISRLKK